MHDDIRRIRCGVEPPPDADSMLRPAYTYARNTIFHCKGMRDRFSRFSPKVHISTAVDYVAVWPVIIATHCPAV